MKRRWYQFEKLVRACRTQPRATFLAFVLCLAVTAAPALALTINLNFDPDSTFQNAGLSSTDIANMKAAAAYAASQFTTNLSDGVHVNIRVTAVARNKYTRRKQHLPHLRLELCLAPVCRCGRCDDSR